VVILDEERIEALKVKYGLVRQSADGSRAKATPPPDLPEAEKKESQDALL